MTQPFTEKDYLRLATLAAFFEWRSYVASSPDEIRDSNSIAEHIREIAEKVRTELDGVRP